jgi:hypothetical protein
VFKKRDEIDFIYVLLPSDYVLGQNECRGTSGS